MQYNKGEGNGMAGGVIMEKMTEKEVLEALIRFRNEAKKREPKRDTENIKLYLVGGAVRDMLMNRGGIEDKDYCITGITTEEMMEIFPDVKIVGEKYSVFLLHVDGDPETEFALARVERKTGLGYHGTEPEMDIKLTIVDDLERRDLTINAIAMNIETGEMIDPYGGISDIQDKIIRATSEKFKEDPLRIYRAARFAARYGYEIEKKTLLMMESIKDELGAITGERIHIELSKVMKDKKMTAFFRWLYESNVIVDTFYLKEFKGENISEVEGHFKEFHSLKERDTELFEKMLTECDQMNSSDDLEAFCVLLHYFSDREVEQITEKFKMPKEYKQIVLFMNHHYEKMEKWEEMNATEKVEFLSKLISHPLTKQSESLGELETIEWFISVSKTLHGAKGESFNLEEVTEDIKKCRSLVSRVKITPEEIQNKGLKGKEIGEYLQKKREEKLSEVK